MEIKKIGAHVSAVGGLHVAVEKANKMGCNALQLFSGSPRVWAKKPLADINLDKLFSNVRQYTVSPIFTHALYLVNLASEKPELLKKSYDSLKYELEFDALIKGSGVVVHLGSHMGRGWDAVKDQVCEQIVAILKDTPLTSKFLIENSAGQQGKIGSPLEEVRWLLDEAERIGGYVSSNRLGWCFDTCHGFASGYHLAGGDKNAVDEITKLKLWDTLTCIHVNDSKDPFNSGRDRHENLNDGTIPAEEMSAFLNNSHIAKIPLILEAPGIDKEGPDAENVKRLKKIIGML
jgi:deoxyribonuclease-4